VTTTRAALLALVVAVAGCGFAPTDSGAGPDAPAIDARAIDAPAASDAPGIPDAPADAAAELLAENTSLAPATGDAVYCHGTQLSRDNHWYRAFRLSDYGVAGTFHVADARVPSERCRGAAVTVSIYEYAGAWGATSLDVSTLALVATATATPPDSDAPQALVKAIAADVTGTFVVEVAAVDTQTSTGTQLTYFHLGANQAGQTAPNYYRSAACGVDPPAGQSSDAVIAVDGTP